MKRRGLFITGVGTGVGKTVAAGAVAHLLVKDGYDVKIMKPVQAGALKKKDGRKVSPDLEFIRKASRCGGHNDISSLPYAFSSALSPYHAATKAKQTIDLKKIAVAFSDLKKDCDLVIVEGAGGLMAPLTEEESWPALIRLLDIPLIIVTHTALGMIHDTISAVMAAELHGLEMAGFIIVETSGKKHPEPDTALLEKHTRLPLLGILPHTRALEKKDPDFQKFRLHVEKHIAVKPITDFIERRGSAALQKQLEKIDKEKIWHPFTQMREWEEEPTLIISSGSGTLLKDIKGRSYYDGHSSYWVNVHGHCHPGLVRTLTRQAGRLEHSTFLGLSNRPAIELAEALLNIAPSSLERVFYSDNGSTAVEAGLKMAFQYHKQKSGTTAKKTKFATLVNAYHGDTMGAMGVGGIELYRNIFGPIISEAVFIHSPYCYRCPLDKIFPACSLACAVEMEKTIARRHEEIAAFVVEPIVQCPGGIITAPRGYFRRIREVCDRYDILLIADEVAVGFGRTGRMFACEHEEVQPDIMAISKSFAGGMLPLAATLATREIFDVFRGTYDECKTFFHGHTFTGHPLACAVALENIRLMAQEDTLASVEFKSQFMADELVRFENLPHVGDIRQAGMIVGVELVKNRETKEPFTPSMRTGHMVAMEARKKGLIIRPLGDVMSLFPILSSETNELREMAEILYDSITAATSKMANNCRTR